MSLLDHAARRLLERLRLHARPKATSTDQGTHRSNVRAGGLEFADHREYVAGDDARKIDWKAFARNRTLSVRTYEEERDVRVYVLVDVSASMTRGTPPKLEVARQIAAAFGYLGMKQTDRVQVIPFTDGVAQGTPTMRHRDDYPTLEAFLEGLEAGGITTFARTVSSFVQRFPARGRIVVVSDLMEMADWSASVRQLAQRGHQVCFVRVVCGEDVTPDFRGEIELADAETGETLRVTMTPALASAYRTEIAEHVERVREACRRVGGMLIEAPVETVFEELLRRVLAPAVERA